MSFVRSPKNVTAGDVVVFIHYPECSHISGEEQYDLHLDWIEIGLAKYHDYRESSYFGGFCYVLTKISDCEFDASSYSGHNFVTYGSMFDFETLYLPKSIGLFGVIKGQIDLRDGYSSKRFLRKIVKRYRPIFLHKYQQYSLGLTS